MEDDPEEGKDGAETPEHQAVQLQTPSKNKMIGEKKASSSLSRTYSTTKQSNIQKWSQFQTPNITFSNTIKKKNDK